MNDGQRNTATWRAALMLHGILAVIFLYLVLPSPSNVLYGLSSHAQYYFWEWFAEPPEEVPEEFVRTQLRKADVRTQESGLVIQGDCMRQEVGKADAKGGGVTTCEDGVGSE